jgi:hypothetical protein
MRQRLQDGMTGAVLGFLQGPGKIGCIERGTHSFATMAIHHADFRGAKLARGIEHMRQHWLAGDGVQHLG